MNLYRMCAEHLIHLEKTPLISTDRNYNRHAVIATSSTAPSPLMTQPMTSSHSTPVWSSNNPEHCNASSIQHSCSIKVWPSLVDKLQGPFVLEERLNRWLLPALPQEKLQFSMEDIPLQARLKMWLRHNGAPPHVGGITGNLNGYYGKIWFGCGGLHGWPFLLTDLTPHDLYLAYTKEPRNRRTCRHEMNF